VPDESLLNSIGKERRSEPEIAVFYYSSQCYDSTSESRATDLLDNLHPKERAVQLRFAWMAATPALPCMLSHARLKWYDRISLGDRVKMM
jgi:hypothetical protein